MRKAIIVVFFFSSLIAVAQQQPVQYSLSKEQLEVKRKEILEAINETERQLSAVKNDTKATMGQLRALQNKLAERQRLIGNINEELSTIDVTIRNSSKEVGTLKMKLEQLKIRYAQSIRYAYTTRSSYDMIAFLFSSRDFNDAMRRMKYLKKFREFRKQQVVQIRTTQAQLQNKIGTLNAEKAQKDELLSTQVQQKQVLIKETDQTNQVIQDLKGKESKLLKDIEANRKTTVRINKAIEVLIEREMAKAAKAAEEEAKRKAAELAKANPPGTAAPGTKTAAPGTAGNTAPVKPTAPRVNPKAAGAPLLLTPDDVALAANFEGNKGKLYWPVEKGYITDHFGSHPHPLAPKVIIENSGIDIQTGVNAPVRAVFDGTVTNVFSTVGSQQIVMVQHGNYFTVYNGLATVSVKKGQEVKAKQVLGQVATNDEDLPVINFQIWMGSKKGQVKLNPEQWIGHAH